MDEELEARRRLDELLPACDIDAVLAAAGALFVARFKRLMDLDRVEYEANIGPSARTGAYDQLIAGQMAAARWAAGFED